MSPETLGFVVVLVLAAAGGVGALLYGRRLLPAADPSVGEEQDVPVTSGLDATLFIPSAGAPEPVAAFADESGSEPAAVTAPVPLTFDALLIPTADEPIPAYRPRERSRMSALLPAVAAVVALVRRKRTEARHTA